MIRFTICIVVLIFANVLLYDSTYRGRHFAEHFITEVMPHLKSKIPVFRLWTNLATLAINALAIFGIGLSIFYLP